MVSFGPVSSLPVSAAPLLVSSTSSDDSGGGSFLGQVPYHPRRRGKRQIALEMSLGDTVEWSLAARCSFRSRQTTTRLNLRHDHLVAAFGTRVAQSPLTTLVPCNLELDSSEFGWSIQSVAVQEATPPDPPADPYAAQIEEEDELFLLGML